MKYAYEVEEILVKILHEDEPDLKLAECFIDTMEILTEVGENVKPKELLIGAYFVMERFSLNATICSRILKSTFPRLNDQESKLQTYISF